MKDRLKDQGPKGQQIVRQVKLLAALGLVMVIATVGLVGWMLGQVRAQRRVAAAEEEVLDRTSRELRQQATEGQLRLRGILDTTTSVREAQDAVGRLTRSIRALSGDHGGPFVHLPAGQVDPLLERLGAAARRVAAWRASYDEVWRDAGPQRTLGRARALVGKLRTSLDVVDGRRRLDDALRYRRWRGGGGAAGQAAALLRGYALEENRGTGDFRDELAECAQLVELLNGEEDLDHLADIRDNKLKPVLARLQRLIATLDVVPAEDAPLTPELVEDLKSAVIGGGSPSGAAPSDIHRGGLFGLRHDLLHLRREREALTDEIAALFQDVEAANAAVAHTAQVRTDALTQQVEGGLLSAWLQLLLFSAASVASFLWLARRISGGINGQVQAIETRNRDMRLVLDNVEQGLLTLNRDGTLLQERSAAVDRWFGPPGGGETFWDYLRRAGGGSTADVFRLHWDMLLEDVMSADLCIDQLPQGVTVGGLALRIDYRPLLLGETLDKMLVVISDVTGQLARERAEADQRDLLAAFQKILANKDGFANFFNEACELVKCLTGATATPLPVVKRLVHTLKGNSALFGLRSLAGLCHDLETRMAERGADMSGEDRELLRQCWADLSQKLGLLVGGGDQKIFITDEEHERALAAIRAGAPRRELVELISHWRLQQTQSRLQVFADQARELGRRLGKAPISVLIESNELRLHADRWTPFFGAFIHVVRNAVDHGIEAAEERRGLDKPQTATVVLRTFLLGRHFIVEIADDGRGIAWERVAQKAGQAGLPAATREDLIAALFSDGLSTREEVTEHSGRGVGLAAVKAACEELGGEILVDSEPGRGTTFRFRFPSESMAPEGDMTGSEFRIVPTRPPQAARRPS